MKKIFYPLAFLLIITIMSCEELGNYLEEEKDSLTESEVVEGLKTALQVGTDTAVTVTSQLGGYYQDEIIKILLPEDVKVVQEYMVQLGLSDQLDKFILSMNRAAEDAANEAGPIFTDAITSLSISDGWDILNGINPAEGSLNKKSFDSTAATNYLISTTYNSLYDAFQPKIQNSLDKDLVSGISTNEIWTTLTSTYNAAAQFNPAWETINTDLDNYVTEEGLDGLFYKVAQEEKAIRRDPLAWAQTTVGDILERVFGDNE